MRLTVFAALAACLCVLAACSKEAPAPPARENAPAAAAPEAAPAPAGIDIGDVESSIVLKATVRPEGLPPQVTVEEMETSRGRTALCTVTVRPPYPQHLTLRMDLEPQRGFAERPVVLRGGAFRDDTPLSPPLQTVVAETKPGEAVSLEVDLMQGLAAPPASMLVVGKLDAFLMDANTSAAGLDPATASSASRTQLLSNPVRVNFVPAEAAP